MRCPDDPRFRLTVTQAQMIVFGLLLSLVLFAHASGAELHEWTDDDGRVHYTNEPRPGSKRTGLAPIALDPADSDQDSQTEITRRQRLKRNKVDRWVDRLEESPAQSPDAAVEAPSQRPAAAAQGDRDSRERSCQERHGMSCERFEAWIQFKGFECGTGDVGQECRAAAKREIEKADRAEARRRLEQQDAERLAR